MADANIARVEAELTALEIKSTVVKHAAVMTSEEHAAVEGLPEGVLAKNLFMKSKKKKLYLVVIRHDRKVDLKKLSKQLKSGAFRMDRDNLTPILGVTQGCVTPLAVMNDEKNQVTVVIDKDLDVGEGMVLVHPLTNEATLSLSGDNMKRFIEAKGNTLIVQDFDAPLVEEKKQPKPKQQPKKKKGQKKEHKNQDGLTATKSGNFPLWYQQVVKRSGMIEYYDISGCYILKPWSFRIWEFITAFFDAGIKKQGVQNAYFPLFVTKKSLEAEEDHVDGFAAEVAWVTHSGQSKLAEPIAVRPTSETIMYPAYAKWIRSHRDLPLKLNQWTNVVRWEFSNPTPFIRTREFLWQEGHSAFATQGEAEEEVLDILDLYASVYEDLLAIPVTKGKKTELEKFPGGYFTTTVEAFISATGRGLQGATSHCLGTNFAKIYGIKYESVEKKRELVWQNSWGLSTRSIGALVMTHSDDKGLVLPPTVAPIQVVIVPILYKKGVEEMLNQCREIERELTASGIRVKVDDDTNHKPGWKFNHWELKGVPLCIELGPRDMKSQQVVVKRRDNGAKQTVAWSDLAAAMPGIMEQMYSDMFNKAKAEKKSRTRQVTTWADFMTAVNSKCVALAPWCGRKACESSIKKRSGEAAVMEEVEACADDSAEAAAAAEIQMTGSAKSLCVPLAQPELPSGTCCVGCENAAINWTMFGRSY